MSMICPCSECTEKQKPPVSRATFFRHKSKELARELEYYRRTFPAAVTIYNSQSKKRKTAHGTSPHNDFQSDLDIDIKSSDSESEDSEEGSEEDSDFSEEDSDFYSETDSVGVSSDEESSDDDNQSNDTKGKVTDSPLSLETLQSVIYEGSSLPVFEVIELMGTWQSEYDIGKEAMTCLFRILKFLMPQENSLPAFITSKKYLERFNILKPLKFEACNLDCQLFDELRRRFCEACHSSRKSGKTFHSLPIQDQLQALLLRPDLVNDWQLPLTPSPSGNTGSLYDSPGWREQVLWTCATCSGFL